MKPVDCKAVLQFGSNQLQSSHQQASCNTANQPFLEAIPLVIATEDRTLTHWNIMPQGQRADSVCGRGKLPYPNEINSHYTPTAGQAVMMKSKISYDSILNIGFSLMVCDDAGVYVLLYIQHVIVWMSSL